MRTRPQERKCIEVSKTYTIEHVQAAVDKALGALAEAMGHGDTWGHHTHGSPYHVSAARNAGLGISLEWAEGDEQYDENSRPNVRISDDSGNSEIVSIVDLPDTAAEWVGNLAQDGIDIGEHLRVVRMAKVEA